MSKSLNFILLVAIISFGMGFIVPTFTSQILTAISSGDFTNLNNSSLYLALGAALALAAGLGVGISVGFIQSQGVLDFLIVAFVTLLGAIVIADISSIDASITQAISSGGADIIWLTNVTHLLFVVIAIGFIISLISWWRGGDG